MNTLSAAARQQQAQARLNKARHLALALLALAALLFVVATLYQPHYPALGYLKAFAEAAMVGALADWFAVVALFRHPLGLPIPHTAILPNNQARIADELARFIEENFLLSRPIAIKIYQAKPAEKILTLLSQAENQALWLPLLSRQLPTLLNTAKAEDVARFLAQLLEEQYDGKRLGKTLADGLVLLRSQGIDEIALLMLLRQIRRWLHDPHTRQLLEANLREWAVQIEKDAPNAWDKFKSRFRGTVVEQIDGWVASKALNWADSYLAAALKDSEHTLRQGFTARYDKMIEALRHSRLWHKRLENGKNAIAQSPAMQQNLIQLWQALVRWTEQDSQSEAPLISLQLKKLFAHMRSQAARYPRFMRRLDVRFAWLIHTLIGRYRHRAARFIADKVKAWDAEEMAAKLELSVGRDLQFIRINGTLVGGLVGLIIYSVEQWLLTH